MTASTSIVVIGAGVIGLTSALEIQSRLLQHSSSSSSSSSSPRTEILIVAREWPASFPGAPATHSPNYASMWAGAHVRPIPASTPQLRREAGWLAKTGAKYARIAKTEPWAGVTETGGVEYLEAPGEDYRAQTKETFEAETGLRGYRKLSPEEMPEGVVLGFEYETYCVNPPLYCLSLLRKFLLRGGKTLRRELASEAEAFALRPNVAFVVNASGTGFGDPKSFPTRGQTAVTNLPSVTKTVTRQNKDGSWSFVIPRSYDGGTIIGGTKEPNNWHSEPSARARETLLSNARSIIPYAGNGPNRTTSKQASHHGQIEVIADIVGRRPTREGGVRIEVEEKEFTAAGGKKIKGRVLHAYGVGGRGYELSWGVAHEVAELAESLLGQAASPRSRL